MDPSNLCLLHGQLSIQYFGVVSLGISHLDFAGPIRPLPPSSLQSLLVWRKGPVFQIASNPFRVSGLISELITHGYQNIKYSILIYNCAYQNQIPDYYVSPWFSNFWKIKWLLTNWQIFAGSFTKPGGSLRFLKYPEPAVLWFWLFFHIPGLRWFFDSELFQIPAISGSLILILIFFKYLELVDYWKNQTPVPHWSAPVLLLYIDRSTPGINIGMSTGNKEPTGLGWIEANTSLMIPAPAS